MDVSRLLGIDGYNAIFDRVDNGDENAQVELIEILTEMAAGDREKLSNTFVELHKVSGEFPTPDLSNIQIQTICQQLEIADEDCWSFDNAELKIEELCKLDDAHLSYIIDLNDANESGGNTRGLGLLRVLHSANSKATAFLLTHAADKNSEASKESELLEELRTEGSKSSPPVCVIAKERLEGDPLVSAVSNGLRIAIKRAGLRRSVHEVLLQASDVVTSAFDEAVASLLEVPPEQLDEYVVNRARAEGVSELHVVERALTAKMSESLRNLFATDPKATSSVERIRALHAVTLGSLPTTPHKVLEDFRKKELWEPSEIVNKSFASLACGDVFKFDPDEGETDERKFILLVQPCDVMIRPKGERDTETGFLVLLKQKSEEKKTKEDGAKQPTLPFLHEGKEWICDFRSVTSVSLGTLDLATLRADGKVRYDVGQTLPKAILPGQEAKGKKLLAKLNSALSFMQTNKNIPHGPWFDSRCALTHSTTGPFSKIANASYVKAAAGNGKDEAEITEHFTWKIQRDGRVRMPYASAIFSNYLSVMGREAFDLDYLKPHDNACESVCAVAVTPSQ